jgi:hypothetical protein
MLLTLRGSAFRYQQQQTGESINLTRQHMRQRYTIFVSGRHVTVYIHFT